MSVKNELEINIYPAVNRIAEAMSKTHREASAQKCLMKASCSSVVLAANNKAHGVPARVSATMPWPVPCWILSAAVAEHLTISHFALAMCRPRKYQPKRRRSARTCMRS